MIFIFIFLLILLLIPIKIKLYFLYNNKSFDLDIYLFKKRISIKGRLKTYIKRFFIKNKSKLNKDIKKSLEIIKDKKSINNFNKNKLIYNLIHNPFKFKLTTDISIAYNLEDMSVQAISYGYIYQLLSISHQFLSLIFDYKIKNQQVKPLFKEENYLYISFESIIYINFAKTIYIMFLILKSLKLGGKNNGK